MVKVFKYEEIMLGQSAEFKQVIREGDLEQFGQLSGDINPLHTDCQFAQNKGYSGKVVYGMLEAAYYSTLVGVYLPGQNCLLHSIEVKFVKPVYVNDQLTIRGKVIEKNDLFKQLTIRAEIINQDHLKVSKALIKVGVMSE